MVLHLGRGGDAGQRPLLTSHVHCHHLERWLRLWVPFDLHHSHRPRLDVALHQPVDLLIDEDLPMVSHPR